jgi:hypothetical protein
LVLIIMLFAGQGAINKSMKRLLIPKIYHHSIPKPF